MIHKARTNDFSKKNPKILEMKNIIAENKGSVHGLNSRVDIAEDWCRALVHWAAGGNDNKIRRVAYYI